MITLSETLALTEHQYWRTLLRQDLSMEEIASISGRNRTAIYKRLHALGIKPVRHVDSAQIDGNDDWQALKEQAAHQYNYQRAEKSLNEQRIIQHGPGVAAGKSV